jgi:mannose-6-phosphate isomerase
MKLATHFVEKPWGRVDLPAAFVADDGRRIGEIWFDAPGKSLPLLVKWLFTSEKLSIQVHPNDAQARAAGMVSGKEEMWVVVSADPDARLGIGTIKPLSADELRAASLSGEIETLMDWKAVQAGDYYYIPAGTVHAIGGGITLVEVQQHADITYRLYDYGRPRELHLDDGVAVSIAKPYDDPRSGRIGDADLQQLVDGPHFALFYAKGDAILKVLNENKPQWITPLSGDFRCDSEILKAGSCIYADENVKLFISPDAVALIAYPLFTSA